MSWFLKVVRYNYANFNGRAQRKEYWMFVLFYVIFALVAGLFDLAISGLDSGLVIWIYMLTTMLPYIAVTVRRLHDTDKSAWWLLLNFIPFGGILLFACMCFDGGKDSNRFGENPKNVVQ